jgi:O-acetyl-ADP-ribose deacetylase (regulator of RNase III)
MELIIMKNISKLMGIMLIISILVQPIFGQERASILFQLLENPTSYISTVLQCSAVSEYIKNHPIKSAAVALSAGVIVGIAQIYALAKADMEKKERDAQNTIDIVLAHERKNDRSITYQLRNGQKIVLKYGSLIKEDTQALVNAANENLDHGGGIAAALAKAIPTLQENSNNIPCDKQSFYSSRNKVRCPVGQACPTQVTGSTNVSPKVKYIIHAVGPRGNDKNREQLLYNAYESCLKQADALQLETIAIPPLSIGIFGYPMEEATHIAVKTIVDYFNPLLSNHPWSTIKEVRLIIWDGDKNKEQQFAMYKQQLDKYCNLK